ncbi:MAG: glycerol-3-phosphate acyltransferase [Ferrovum sp. 37-45-19]|jgi:glycerol-3-phosphate acyltransferase PlsY|uniref:glycerol-3-phosphate 1-O-acyltransferase PlsY n=1 Tax=Ferrovum sp. JA12 TaxID=1356299 RepID=UPI0007027B50|nr:glycerol-3-phosphate 1-O-acyltransferase PlsY [Ferrovum sp. JA12]OYV80568.1 MAG: glycerol-3-phosphate acyltransferase [Ferrovum sp. 21-44-67]OYV94883.1 MAG: glycerol-3-phosphate acyltransferase [Ferrovum sp. 37-45-19]OZB34085.1 MAG: glycerol-3-phosphate acyltransferase [Ferrovum sp. 34-44-207]HQT80984.1 glycerol-3-phosphate 1-O-acyltransferase PlsY [Ferrovaceae bacterium]KRH79291.1 putative glycerol-3-phosphate acyltransferase [Ferrovum sp. JA12]
MTLIIVTILFSYVLGSLSFAVIVSRAMGLPDPRSFGSKNPGATNMLRGGNKLAALLVLFGDALKGWLAVWLTNHVVSPHHLNALEDIAALAVFIGHGYPIFFGFKGGKGVATALGILLALNPLLGALTFLSWLFMIIFSRISSLSALTALVVAPVLSLWLSPASVQRWTVFVLAVLLLAHHHSNIRKLLSGKETVFKKP